MPDAQQNQVYEEADIINVPPEGQVSLVPDIPPPSQGTANWIWLIIVSTFAIVLLIAISSFVAAIFRGPEDIELLLTVVTTIAGILAGFVSGRSSTSDT